MVIGLKQNNHSAMVMGSLPLELCNDDEDDGHQLDTNPETSALGDVMQKYGGMQDASLQGQGR
jgi:hypothetical protein